jgi:dinuclear metal center protein, YbgI family
MVTMKDIAAAIERKAPLQLQEAWDNCGLQLGHMASEVRRVLTTLDVTPDVVAEAIEQEVDCILSHHPMIFKGLKSINMGTMQGKMIGDLLCHRINVYSAHTNLDVTGGGLNDEVATRLGLQDIQGLEETGRDVAYKVAVYVPVTHSDQVRKAMGDAGSGHIGNYSHCSFSVTGEGRFLPLEGTNPFIGHVGSIETVQEERIETVVPKKMLGAVLGAMEQAHPYEEIAYDVVALENAYDAHYIGRIGNLPYSLSIDAFKEVLQSVFPHSQLRWGGAKVEQVQRIALCTGSGAEFIKVAAKQNADVYITGDVKYHDMQLAKELGILVVDAGHYGTEYMSQTILKRWIEDAFPQGEVKVIESESQRDFFFEV